jgi:hypothetical protein
MPSILVNDVLPVISYVATASQTLFSVPFEFFNVADIVVQRQEVTLTYSASPANNNQYSVTGAGAEGGGSITLGGAGATLSDRVVIYRDVKIERLANYPETGPMSVRSLNAEQSKHIAMMQQLERDLNRGVIVPIDESAITLPSAATRANKILSFDETGNANTTFSISTVPNLTPVPVLNGGTGTTSITSGFLVKGNGTSALSASVIQDNGTSIGIGAAASGAKLDVSGLIRSRTSTATIDVNHDGTNGSLASSSTLLVYANGANSIIMHTNGVERFRITSTGGITSSDLVDAVGYKGLPQNARTASYTLALTDMGKHISITTGGVVVPANASVAFPIGSTVIVYNDSASSQNITITTDTMYLAGTATTGTRALAQRGLATLVKVAATTWVASGAGLT